MTAAKPTRGDVWTVDFDPTRGHEQAGKRPALVLSATMFNAGPAGLVVVLPLTTKDKGIRSHVRLNPPEGGIRRISFIKCEDIRSVSLERLEKRIGGVTAQTLQTVEYCVRILLDL